MDRGSKQTLATDAISLASSFANLKLNPSPFNLLPNEILLKILSKVERMVPIQKFARLRSVDTRWRFVVDDICKNKKSLLVIIGEKDSSTTLHVEDLFFGLLNEAAFSLVKIESLLEVDENGSFTVSIFESLLKVLPNIEQLFVYCTKLWEFFDSNGIEPKLVTYVNSLCSLKKLYLDGAFAHFSCYYFERLKNTLSKLEFYFFNKRFKNSSISLDRSVAINFDYVRQLHARNPRWLANVFKLSFTVELNDQFDQVVNFLREHATRLSVLHIKFCDTSLITPILFSNLRKLTRLNKITLGPVKFEVLKQVAKAIEENKFKPIYSIRNCNLVISDFDVSSVTNSEFVLVLTAMFPIVNKWKFVFVPGIPKKENAWFLIQINSATFMGESEIVEKSLDEFFELCNFSFY